MKTWFWTICILGLSFKLQTLYFPTSSKIDSKMIERIEQLAGKYHPWVVEIRRHLHAHPELSGQEKETMAYIASILDSLGISYQTNVGGLYSVVAEIPGKNPRKKRIVLRADTDALPIFEVNDVPYRSKNDGVSHKCGHDSHSANLLGVARILNELRGEFEGTITLVWQPHEEKLPGGAPALIAAGVLDGASACIGLHVDPNIPVGSIGIKSGEYMASIDELEVTVVGKGAHGGSGVHLSVDPVLAAAHLLVGLEQIKSHNCPATTPMALTFGKIRAGEAPNVIPDTCLLNGTFRTLSDEWRSKAHQRMLEIADGVGKSTGADIRFNIKKGHPVLENHPDITALLENASVRVLGQTKVQRLNVWLASEDFAHYGKVVPSCFFRLGVRNEALGITAGLHTKNFDIDESALKTGVVVMSVAALEILKTVR